MAFDGVTVAALTNELQTTLAGGSIQKIAQPEPDELMLTIKNNRQQFRLLLSANASLPLVHLTEQSKLSPLTAPNFCMLLRKHLSGAKILSITQPSLERIIEIRAEHLNELGDIVSLRLIIELMGKYSNIILTDDTNVIIDSMKHINHSISSVREVLPGKPYFVPDKTNKKNPFEVSVTDWNDTIFSKPSPLSKAVYTSLTGLSSLMAHELSFRAGLDGDMATSSLNGNNRSAFLDCYREFLSVLETASFSPVVYFENGIPKEYSAVPLSMYEHLDKKEYASISEAVEYFYKEKAIISRIRQKSSDLRKHVTMLIERCSKKIDLQTKQLKDTEKKETYKMYGELIQTYGYTLSTDEPVLTCTNYYTGEEVHIPMDVTLTPMENANRYFEKYQKMKRTKEAITLQLQESTEMLSHLDSVLNELDIARREEDLYAIRRELEEAGYIKRQERKKGKVRSTGGKPLHFVSSDGYDIFVGKNNFQNDELTFKIATGNDWWFHAKQMPGSHVIIKCNNEEPPIQTFEEAANLAAYFSKGRGAQKVEIDYTQKKNVKKPSGAKPGFVVYYTNYSMIGTSDISGISCVNSDDLIFVEGRGL